VRRRTQSLQELDAVHVRHVDVAEHNVGWSSCLLRQGQKSVGGFDDVEPFGAQRLPNKPSDHLRIVNE
jgi:hypothetical protein